MILITGVELFVLISVMAFIIIYLQNRPKMCFNCIGEFEDADKRKNDDTEYEEIDEYCKRCGDKKHQTVKTRWQLIQKYKKCIPW